MSTSSSHVNRRTVSTHDLLVHSARRGIEIQRADGSFPPGRNYSYDEESTPVRTTTQWLRTLTKAHELTGEKEFKQAANEAIDFLLSDECRPSGFTYHCRSVGGKDYCNGLVGQASVIRALAFAADELGRDDARRTAVKLFELHPFDYELGLWEIIEINGKSQSFDRTLNHQLLFAGAATRIVPHSPSAEEEIERLLDSLDANMRIRPNGLIRHYVRPPLRTVLSAVLGDSRHRVMIRNEIAYHYYTRSKNRRRKERGYQTVNLTALAEIHNSFPTHSFWESDKFQKSLQFVRNHETELLDRINTKHGDALPAIGVARIYSEFGDPSESKLQTLIANDISESPLSGRTPFRPLEVDEQTEAALVCQLVELPEIEIEIS